MSWMREIESHTKRKWNKIFDKEIIECVIIVIVKISFDTSLDPYLISVKKRTTSSSKHKSLIHIDWVSFGKKDEPISR